MTSVTQTTQNVLPIPEYAITPLDWAMEASRRAAEYTGMPEGTIFLVEARRYLAMDALIKKLKAQIEEGPKITLDYKVTG